MPSARNRIFNVSSVAIIGSGPSGIAAAKYLLAENAFQRIDILEQRSKTGGLWDYHPSKKYVAPDFPIPQTDPNKDPNLKASPDSFLSPIYDQLETNIPRGLMGFSDLDWPKDSALFPKHETVTQYIERYAKDVRHLIKFGTRVISAKPASDDDISSGWQITTETEDQIHQTHHYDAIVAASGHFNVPYIPSLKGLPEWRAQHPDTISHSMFYKTPETYRNKKTLIIGNGASGVDIASQIVQTCAAPLLQSVRSESFLLTTSGPTRLELPEIAELRPHDRSVLFTNGHVETSVDAILFCTGYFYSLPWLHVSPSPSPITDGSHVENTYQHLFYRPNPTLVFPVLQQRVIPFPMAEVQAAVVARVWAGRLGLPSEAEMRAWEEAQAVETGGGRGFHVLKFPQDGEYINMMHDWAMSAAEGKAGRGKEPPRWDEEAFWLRERFPQVKKAYNDLGERRREVRGVEELGFDFAEWKREKEREDKGLV
ncbi:flavin-binding monooxygenase-like protein 5 [Elsinoe australis]|uniref:Flavin-binding monooxygenase-like protein 5 n=1 Tax=Elsinoe australis TaxID=40998 RepID=A0A4U7AUG6_9PEZI|nr:flavin-binding monooxygenase-like protein 5 [Elsinoe australis]